MRIRFNVTTTEGAEIKEENFTPRGLVRLCAVCGERVFDATTRNFHHREPFRSPSNAGLPPALVKSLFFNSLEGLLVSSSGTSSRAARAGVSAAPLSWRQPARGGHRAASEGGTRGLRDSHFSVCQAVALGASEDRRSHPSRHRNPGRHR